MEDQQEPALNPNHVRVIDPGLEPNPVIAIEEKPKAGYMDDYDR